MEFLTKSEFARNQIVLSLFPGAGLFDKPFEDLGFTVLRGPDYLFGSDIHDFNVPANRFDGIIGGPPCQSFSGAAVWGSKKTDLISQYMRVFEQAKPKWAVIENVRGAIKSPYIPNWPYTDIKDFDCGGLTHRVRRFWVYGVDPLPKPPKREGKPEYSVLATSWKDRSNKKAVHSFLTWDNAARLQGFEEKANLIMSAIPTDFPKGQWSKFIVHMMGNGVPYFMGKHIANHIIETEYLKYKNSFQTIANE